MPSKALVDAMEVDNIPFLIEILGADAAPLQYIRELVQNEIESILKTPTPEGRIEIDHEEIQGVRKLRISGNGEGMTPGEVAANINRLSASGSAQAFDKNFGIGAKITALTRSPHGVIYKCWKVGTGSVTMLGRVEDGRYGRIPTRAPDGNIDYWLPLGEDEPKPPTIETHGVSVVLLGKNAGEDTTVAPPGSDLPSQWVTAYLDRRYFRLPPNIAIHVPRQIFDSQLGSHRMIYDEVRVQGHYLDKHCDHRGAIELPEADATVWWWLLSEDITKGGKTWSNRGHVAALYQNELYDVRSGSARSSALKDFGVYAGFGRVVLYVEPRNVLKANTARTVLIIRGGASIDYSQIGAAFVERMPDAIAAFMAGQVTSEHGDHKKQIRKNLKEVEDELEVARYRRGRGNVDSFDPEDGGTPPNDAPPRDRRQPGGSGGTRDASGRVGAEYLRKAEEERERKMRGEKIDVDPAPQIVWDKEEGDAVISGRAATYNSAIHLVTASPRYGLYKDMIEWAFGAAKVRATGDMADDALRAIAKDEVQKWFEQAFSEVVVALRPLARDANWGPTVFDTGLSDEGLTAAIASHRWHIMAAIRRDLGLRLGAKSTSVPIQALS